MRQSKIYIAGRMDYPDLPDFLLSQWEAILPAHSAARNARACMAVLDDGSVFDAVYVASAQDFIDNWGVWPKDDHAKREIDITRVRQLLESPRRLPSKFAEKIRETRMGGCDFTLMFSDNTKQAYITGNAVDFLELPSGKSMTDVIDVFQDRSLHSENYLQDLQFFWCLFGSGEGRRGGLTSRSS